MVLMERPLRILVAHQAPRARTGGMSRLMGFIHDQVSLAGHVVDYFCADDVPRALDGRLARFSFPLLVSRHAIAAARLGQPYDIINIHEPSAAAISNMKRAAGHPCVVVTSHGVERRGWELSLEELRLGREGPTRKTRLLYPLTSLWQSSMGLRGADHIFCLNCEDRSYLMERFNLVAEKITRIYPATDAHFAASAGERDYSRAGRLLFAGSWLKRKGIEDLIPAFVALAARHRQLTLTVLGGGMPEAEIHAAFPEYLRSRIKCHQAVTDAETASLFADADIYLLPSLFEGTPLTLMEAMMSGLPIVTTATCGMKDVIQHGINGLLVPIRSPEAIVEAVEQLMSDAACRARLGRTAQAEALEKYNWERVAAPVCEVYESLCSRQREGKREGSIADARFQH
jgi:glycosyltransferase involved in cell wall biosynthesis